MNSGGFFLGATVLDEVQNDMTVANEEIFGPVLNVMRANDLEAAMETVNRSPYGNGASIFTRSGKAAREFKHRVKAGMVRHQYRRACLNGLVSVHRLGRLLLWRSAYARQRRDAIFHTTKSDNDSLVC